MENETPMPPAPKPEEVAPLQPSVEGTPAEQLPSESEVSGEDVNARFGTEGYRIGPDGTVLSPEEVDEVNQNK